MTIYDCTFDSIEISENLIKSESYDIIVNLTYITVKNSHFTFQYGNIALFYLNLPDVDTTYANFSFIDNIVDDNAIVVLMYISSFTENPFGLIIQNMTITS